MNDGYTCCDWWIGLTESSSCMYMNHDWLIALLKVVRYKNIIFYFYLFIQCCCCCCCFIYLFWGFFFCFWSGTENPKASNHKPNWSAFFLLKKQEYCACFLCVVITVIVLFIYFFGGGYVFICFIFWASGEWEPKGK